MVIGAIVIYFGAIPADSGAITPHSGAIMIYSGANNKQRKLTRPKILNCSRNMANLVHFLN